MNSASGVKASGPLKNFLTGCGLHRRHAVDRVREQLLHAVPVLGQQLRLEVRPGCRRAPTAYGVALVAAHARGRRPRCGSRRGCRGRAASAAARSGGSSGSVTRYWWPNGMIGMSTPTSRPISGAYMPAALTTTSHLDRPLVGHDRVRRGRRAGAMPVTRVRVSISAPSAARAVGERERQLARVEVAVAGQEGGGEHARRCSCGGNSSCASCADTISIGRPKVRPRPPGGGSPRSRAGDEASRRPPSWCQPGSLPVSSRQLARRGRPSTASSASARSSSAAGRRARRSATSSRA